MHWPRSFYAVQRKGCYGLWVPGGSVMRRASRRPILPHVKMPAKFDSLPHPIVPA